MWDLLKRSWLLNLSLLLVLVVVGVGAFEEARIALQLKREEEAQSIKVAELQKRKSDLEAKLLSLDHPEGVEREAKGRLNLKKPGEEVVVVLSDDSVGSSSADRATFWDRVKNLLNRIFR